MPITRRHTLLAATMIAAAISSRAIAVNPSFSGAEGYGGTFVGTAPAGGWFSNAEVYHVTRNDDHWTADKNGTLRPTYGTLRGAFWNYTDPTQPKQNASNRIVVFDVGGVFNLTQGSLDMKVINNIYVAGQTAPSPVTVYGDTSQITHSSGATANNSNVILRYMSFRRGSATSGNTDAITFAGGGASSVATNMILDHVSSSWSTDEDLSITNYNTNVTVQYSIIADSLRTDHAYGTLLRAQVDSNVTLHHNLYANNASRQARFGSYNGATLTADFKNNVVYNWRDRVSYTGGASEADPEISHINYEGNYLLAGPSTAAGSKSSTAFTMDVSSYYKNILTGATQTTPKDPLILQVYQNGNAIDSNHDGVFNAADTGWGMFVASDGTNTVPLPDFNYAPNAGVQLKMTTPFGTPAVSTQTAADAYNSVIGSVGNWWWARDAIDSRIVGNVTNNTNPPDGVAATAPNATELANLLATPLVTRAANYDTDNDGMPDTWEVAHGLNPTSNADWKLDYDTDGYINLQEYLDEVGAFPAPKPVSWIGGTGGRYALISNWDIPFQPSRFDTVQIESGRAVVDAIGQEAKNIVLGVSSTSTASLGVSSGWLRVAGNITIGQAAGSSTALDLAGGRLIIAGTLSGGAPGSSNVFNWTGGTLAAANVTSAFLVASTGGQPGTLTQNGTTSVLAPGDTGVAGLMLITGSYRGNGGSIAIDLGGASSASAFQVVTPASDRIAISGALILSGTKLSLATLNGYDPAPLTPHILLSSAQRTGVFSTVTGHQFTANKWLAITYAGNNVLATATTPGDANVDGAVNFNDLLALASSYGTTASGTWSQGDFTGDGVVNFSDLLVLASFYGTPVTGSFASDWAMAQALVPEPATLTTVSTGTLLALRRRR
ncbi:MAG: hypothetical protein QM770_04420 [Tepidisphaeraceae bacterium]